MSIYLALFIQAFVIGFIGFMIACPLCDGRGTHSFIDIWSDLSEIFAITKMSFFWAVATSALVYFFLI